MRFAFIPFLIMIAAGLASAQVVGSGTFTVTYGYFINAQGKKVSMAGKQFPFIIEAIPVRVVNPAPSYSPRKQSGFGPLDSTVYRNDHGDSSYFASAIPMPSALDDLVFTSQGAGATWQTFTFGMYCDFSNLDTWFFIRWIGFTTFVSGRGPGVSAFDNPVIDFGGNMNLYYVNPFLQVPGAFKLTLNVSGANASVPGTTCYFAQQFREGMGNPDAPFFDQVSTVFSSGGVQTGSSQDLFYFDNDPNGPDGIYDETEIDMFDPGNEANFLLQIDATSNGVTETRLPSSFTYLRGINLSGGLSDLWDSDDSYLVSRPGVVLSSAEAPVQIQLESTSTTTNVTGMRFILEAHTSVAAFNQKIELWNFSTNSWTQVDSRNSTTADSTVDASVANPAEYVQAGTRKIRAKLSWKQNAPVLSYPWQVYVDRGVWAVTRP